MKVSKISGGLLDCLVATCEGVSAEAARLFHNEGHYNYSCNWAQGGLIIERECINLEWTGIPSADFFCTIQGEHEQSGTTPLVAAMRCYVASKLGDTVTIPTELKGM